VVILSDKGTVFPAIVTPHKLSYDRQTDGLVVSVSNLAAVGEVGIY